MEPYQIVLDEIMCLLWITTYTLCFISTLKYRHPALSPLTQLIIAPFEFAVVVSFIAHGSFGMNYASVAYAYWTFIEIALGFLILRHEYGRRQILLYLLVAAAMTLLMIYLVAVKNQMFFFSYFNTFIGEIFWLYYVLSRAKYPLRAFNLAAFLTKWVADILAVPIYYKAGHWISSIICVALPILDFFFLVAFYQRYKRAKVANVSLESNSAWAAER